MLFRILFFALICTFALSENKLQSEKRQSQQATPKNLMKVYEKIDSINERLDKIEANSPNENNAIDADEIKTNNTKLVNAIENVFKKLEKFEKYFEKFEEHFQKNIKIEEQLLKLIEKSDEKSNSSAIGIVSGVTSQFTSMCETMVNPWKNETSEKIKKIFEKLELCLKENKIKSGSVCDPNPCLHGGLCKVISNGSDYKCTQCPSFTNGKNCENVKCDASNKCFLRDDTMYVVFEIESTWEDANRKCVSEGMQMPMPKDKATSEFIQKTLVAMYGTTASKYFWIGLKNNVKAQKWQWIDGSALGDYTGGVETFLTHHFPDCGILVLYNDSFMWGPTGCVDQWYPLCEQQLFIH